MGLEDVSWASMRVSACRRVLPTTLVGGRGDKSRRPLSLFEAGVVAFFVFGGWVGDSWSVGGGLDGRGVDAGVSCGVFDVHPGALDLVDETLECVVERV